VTLVVTGVLGAALAAVAARRATRDR